MFDLPLRPELRARVALHLVIELAHKRREPAVVPPRADGVRQQPEGRVVLDLRVGEIERLFQR